MLSFKMVCQYAPTAFLLLAKMLFLMMKQGCAYPVAEIFEIFEEMERDFLKKKKTQKV